jgi:hypothetical protein
MNDQSDEINQIGVPYIRAKAKDYFEQLGGGLDSDVEEGLAAGQLRALNDQVRIISSFHSVLTLPYRPSKALSDVCSRRYTRMRTWPSSCGY